jgi:hypothetical protein
MSLHYLNGILTEKETIQAINNNAFNKGIKQMRQPEFKTPYTMNSYDVNDCLFYPPTPKKQVAVNGWFQDAIQNVVSTTQAAVTNVTQTAQTAATNVQQTLSTGVQNVLTTGQQALSTIQSQGQAALTNVTSTIQAGIQNLQVPPFFQQNLTEMWNEATAFVGKYGKKIALQPYRQAFIICVAANVFRMGTNLANSYNKDKNKVTNWWVNIWGGDINILKQAIDKSSNIKLNGITIGDPITLAAVTAAIATATAAIVSCKDLMKQLGIGPKDIDDGLKNVTPDKNAKTVTATSSQTETVPTDAQILQFQTEVPGSTNKTLMYVGLGGALLIGGYLLMKKKK